MTVEIAKEEMKDFIKLHNIYLNYYRKKYSKYIPFRQINKKIKRKWQIFKYIKKDDVFLFKNKCENHISKIKWRDNIADIKIFI